MGNPESEVKSKRPFPVWLLLLAAPFIIAIWVVMNPAKFWQQVKKDLELS